MAVLVTRPGKDGIELCEALTSLHIDAIHHPLIKLQPTQDHQPLIEKLQTAEIIIAVSQHAVHYAHQILSQHRLSWPEGKLYLAVGQKTAYKLGKVAQQKVHYPTTSDSEHLLQLPQIQSVSQCSIIILRGNGGRELLYQSLLERDAKVEYIEVYRRSPLPFDPEQVIQHWRSRNIDTLVLTSGEQLQYLDSSLSEMQRNWLQTLSLLVPSQRIATIARELGYKNIVNIGSAANSDLLNAIGKKQTGQEHGK